MSVQDEDADGACENALSRLSMADEDAEDAGVLVPDAVQHTTESVAEAVPHEGSAHDTPTTSTGKPKRTRKRPATALSVEMGLPARSGMTKEQRALYQRTLKTRKSLVANEPALQCNAVCTPALDQQLNQQAIALQSAADNRPRVRQLSIEEYRAYHRQVDNAANARRRQAHRGCEDLNVEPHDLGRMNIVCANERCKALHWSAESKAKGTFNDCCRHGKVFFEDPPEYPAALKDLLLRQHPKWRRFFAKIRNFNSSVAFVGIGMKHVNLGPGVPHMRIQGKVMTTFNHALHPDAEEERSYGQLFIVDTDEAVQRRVQDPRNEGMDEEIARLIDMELRRVNPYVDAFQMADELMRETRRRVEEQRRNAGLFEPVPEPEVQLIFHPRDGTDPRNYDLPKANEVAAIFTTDADGLVPEAYITVHERGKDIRRLRYIDPMLEPAAFPLLYPAGCRGYTLNIPLRAPDGNRKDASRREYACWRMAVRGGKFNPLHHSGRLFQELAWGRLRRPRLAACGGAVCDAHLKSRDERSE